MTEKKRKHWASHYETTSGYEGPDEDPFVVQLWLLVKIPSGVHGGILGQIVCNGEVRGTLQLKDEDEFNWLKPRIDSERQLKIDSK